MLVSNLLQKYLFMNQINFTLKTLKIKAISFIMLWDSNLDCLNGSSLNFQSFNVQPSL